MLRWWKYLSLLSDPKTTRPGTCINFDSWKVQKFFGRFAHVDLQPGPTKMSWVTMALPAPKEPGAYGNPWGARKHTKCSAVMFCTWNWTFRVHLEIHWLIPSFPTNHNDWRVIYLRQCCMFSRMDVFSAARSEAAKPTVMLVESIWVCAFSKGHFRLHATF